MSLFLSLLLKIILIKNSYAVCLLFYLLCMFTIYTIRKQFKMQAQSSCEWSYELVDGVCQHYILPPSIQTIIGSIAVGLVAGVTSIAGLGGGGIFLIILLLAFNYSSKTSTIIVFSCIVGATMGNLINQMRKSFNKKPLIQYHLAFASIPIMFAGSFIGIFLNKILPSVVIVGLICLMTGISIRNVFSKFIVSYRKQSQENRENSGKVNIITQQTVNPFKSQKNVLIFKNIAKTVCIYLILQMIKGSQNFPSVVGIQPCSYLYWSFQLFSFLIVILFSYMNIQTLKGWMPFQQQHQLSQTQQTVEYQNPIQVRMRSLIQYSLIAGILSGFGGGGGMFLLPMYRSLGCSPLQATSSCAFSVFITAVINCLQGVFFGVIPIGDLVYLFLISCGGSYIVSKLITNKLRQMNRLSVVQGIMLLIITIAFLALPYSLYTRYVRSGYDSQEIFGFGSPC